MLKVDSGRVNDPIAISPIDLADACSKTGPLVVQFSRADAYTPKLLASLNEACALSKELLQVRFYGHYGSHFDATILRHLPDVRDLALDCLTGIAHEDEVGRLHNLKRLSFGVFEFDRPEFLKTIELGRLERLILIETRKRNFDLNALAGCRSLIELFINGHSKGIKAIASLPHLRKLSLGAYAKILRVRALSTLGDLSRFPSLSALRVEDQLQLVRQDLTGASLERLWLYNCKRLAELPGLDRQERLREFRVSRGP